MLLSSLKSVRFGVFLVIILLAFYIAGCSAVSPSDTSSYQSQGDLTQAAKTAVPVSNFGFRLLSSISQSDKTGNIILSPVCIDQAMTLAYNGGAGQTATEFASVLGTGSDTLLQTDQSANNLILALTTADPTAEIDMANAIWVQDGLTLDTTFVSNCHNYLYSTASNIDFINPVGAANAINNWVSTNTKGNITNVVTSNDLNLCDLAISNAVYFHGNWASKFDLSNTMNTPFALSNGSIVSVPMMYQLQYFDYYEDNQVQAVALPYGNGRLNMLVVLPKTGYTLDEIVNTLNTNGIKAYSLGLSKTLIGLDLPRMQISYNQDLKPFLSSLGLSTAFDPTNADFSNLGIGKQYIKFMKHGSILKVDEVGSTASSATGTGTGPLGYQLMTVNHPFFCAIYDSATNAVLFAGLIRNPKG